MKAKVERRPGKLTPTCAGWKPKGKHNYMDWFYEREIKQG